MKVGEWWGWGRCLWQWRRVWFSPGVCEEAEVDDEKAGNSLLAVVPGWIVIDDLQDGNDYPDHTWPGHLWASGWQELGGDDPASSVAPAFLFCFTLNALVVLVTPNHKVKKGLKNSLPEIHAVFSCCKFCFFCVFLIIFMNIKVLSDVVLLYKVFVHLYKDLRLAKSIEPWSCASSFPPAGGGEHPARISTIMRSRRCEGFKKRVPPKNLSRRASEQSWVREGREGQVLKPAT